MAEVVLKKLTKSFGPVVAVDRLDLEVRDRELIVLVGPSGCGKTTTLRLVAGLEQATAGQIRIGGQAVDRLAPHQRGVAMVFQHFALYPHMSVFQNLAFGSRLQGVPKSQVDGRVLEAARLLGIEPLLDRRPAELSGGQRQRVALGRAMVRRPQVFLFDEPLSNLDPHLRASMRAELLQLHRALETTTIHVTHDHVEAMSMADRVAVMRSGRIEQIGTPREVYESPSNRYVAEFVSSLPMNCWAGSLAVSEGAMRFNCGNFQLQVPLGCLPRGESHNGRELVMGIRPEDCMVSAPDSEQGSWCPLPVQFVSSRSLGSDTLLELSANDRPVAARVVGPFSGARGDAMVVFCNMARCHWFDPVTELAIPHGAAAVRLA